MFTQHPERIEAKLSIDCRAHKGSKKQKAMQIDAMAPRLPSGCPHVSAVDSAASVRLRQFSASVLAGAARALESRVETLIEAAEATVPGLAARLQFGADVTIRRTMAGEHGLDDSDRHSPKTSNIPRHPRCVAPDIAAATTTNGSVIHPAEGVPAGNDSGGGNGDTGTNAADRPTSMLPPPVPAPPAPTLPPVGRVHCDSFDGNILCFALCSTKLGTPIYPEAKFPVSRVLLQAIHR